MPKQIDTIQIKTGEKYDIELAGKATTGYQWVALPDTNHLISTKKKFAATASKKLLPGASANEIITVTALKKGKTQLHLQQLRTWEKDAAPAKEITYEIIIS